MAATSSNTFLSQVRIKPFQAMNLITRPDQQAKFLDPYVSESRWL